MERVIARLIFKVGMPVRLNGTSKKGTITKINYEHKDISWDKDKPLFIEIQLASGDRMLCGTHQITRKRAT